MTDYEQVQEFLQAVDFDFPIPLSNKTTISALAEKNCSLGTLCCAHADGRISAMVAGYTNQVINNLGHISLVAARKDSRRCGLASGLIRDFLEIARNEGLSAVHVYTHKGNPSAIAMYFKLGFVLFHPKNAPRPNDVHFIYWLSNPVYLEEKRSVL